MWTATVAIMTHIHTDVATTKATGATGEGAKMALNAVSHTLCKPTNHRLGPDFGRHWIGLSKRCLVVFSS